MCEWVYCKYIHVCMICDLSFDTRARRQRNKQTVNGRSRLSFDGHPHVRAAKVQLDQLFSLPSAELCACVRLCRRAAAVAVAAQSLAQSTPLVCCHLIGCCAQPV